MESGSRRNSQHQSMVYSVCPGIRNTFFRESCQNLNYLKTLTGVMLRQHISQQGANVVLFESSSPTKFLSKTIIQSLFLVLLFASISSPASGAQCDLKNPDSCSFGAVCREVPFGKPMCKCPVIHCMKAGMLDPVCGHNGRHFKTYFNVLCLMLEECSKQKPIKQVCYGRCKTASCRAISPENQHHSPCPRHSVGKCFNGGLCVHSRSMNESFCRCPPEFEGERCEIRTPLKTVNSTPTCSKVPNILVITATILLGLVLVFVIVCLCWRKSSKDDKEDSVWPDTSLENGERTPLRDSARSEFVFPRDDKATGTR